MKRTKLLLLILLLMCICLALFACGGKTYTITFVSNGGTPVAPISTKGGEEITEPAEPTREDYIFDGWHTDKSFKYDYDFSLMQARNLKLYAKWLKLG